MELNIFTNYELTNMFYFIWKKIIILHNFTVTFTLIYYV